MKIVTHDDVKLKGFSEMALVINNPDINSYHSSSKLNFSKTSSDPQERIPTEKYMYVKPDDLYCYSFDFSIQFDVQYFNRNKIGFFEIHIESRIDNDNYLHLGLDSIAKIMIRGFQGIDLVYFDVEIFVENPNDFLHFRKDYVGINPPNSIICHGKRDGSATTLKVQDAETNEKLIDYTFERSNERLLKCISVTYASDQEAKAYNATASNFSANLYSKYKPTDITTIVLGMGFTNLLSMFTIILSTSIYWIKKKR